ncbi:ABC transporter ATP-binding protein [Roseibium litorale]|uniref:ABC transporter ATP-binding protein n=1 Tax=Roseibium litorale TaxID=2803841 RepID=A0ABR9CPA5_9HYPH|nr:ABC transporter ATP-binding protein [Roseibium litorale]MBD8892494.1 ABC transporter ATP-binding protein [Roseibium litorale]
MTTLLTVDSLSKSFRGVHAIRDASFDVTAGKVHGIIGPNGAGKTTLFNLISGLLEPSSGKVSLNGKDISALPSYARTRLGMARTFQNIRLFSEMTVIENVLTGMHIQLSTPVWRTLIPFAGAEERQAKAKAMDLLELVGLADKALTRSASLAYGEQRRLEIARALASDPKILLLDEPAAGMNPLETQDLAVLLKKLNERGITLLLVEHDMRFVMDLCDQITVLNFGKVIAEGEPAAIRSNSAVIEAYLGPKVAERLLKEASA